MIRWDYKWWESIKENWISPYENSEDNIRFTYWWEDMRPKEVEELVKEAYTCGYERGQKELEIAAEERIKQLESKLLKIQLKIIELKREL